jgi:hypothetical protein
VQQVTTSGLDRFISWRRFVKDKQLPEFVYGKYGQHNTEILIPVDSIFAVEHMGRTLKAYGGICRIQEAFPSPKESWVADAYGRHYVAELAISWQGESQFWGDYLADIAQ